MTIKTLDTAEKSVDGQPHYMHTLVFLDDTGHLQVRTNTYSHVWFAGFHGGIVVCLTDRSGGLLYATPVTAYGVDGSAVPFGTSNRWDTEDYNVGAAVAQQTDRIDVLLFRAPDTNLAGFLKTVEDVLHEVEVIWGYISTFIKAIGDSKENNDYGSPMDEDGPTQVTEDALTGALGTLITAVNPAALAYGQQVTFTVSATDSKTGAARGRLRIQVTQSAARSRRQPSRLSRCANHGYDLRSMVSPAPSGAGPAKPGGAGGIAPYGARPSSGGPHHDRRTSDPAGIRERES
jgi:hypothetical protein